LNNTSIAYQVQKADGILPSNIVTSDSIVCHTCWDNFDLNEQTPSGAGTTHSTHGIVIQELSCDLPAIVETTDETRTGSRSFKYIPPVVKQVSIPNKVEPIIPNSFISDVANCCFKFPLADGLCWSVCRALFNDKSTVPEWCGWLSQTSPNENVRLSNVGYLTPIMQPITECSTVYQCLITSMDVSRKLNQNFTFVTFDLAAAKLAYKIMWNKPDVFTNVFVHLGAFHIRPMCCYLGALGTFMAGSGFEEIILQAGVCASGSIAQVMSGKHFNRAMRVHVLMLDAVQRLLLDKFLLHSEADRNDLEQLKMLSEDPSYNNLINVHANAGDQQFLEHFEQFMQSVRNGFLGKTAKFWVQYCDAVWVLLMFQRAIKLNDIQLYIQCLRRLCSLIFSADRLNYARYLPLYHVLLNHLVSSNPAACALLEKYGLSVARSQVNACRNVVDLTIEQTINRSAKTSGGIVGFSRNINAYSRWCLARHKRGTYVDATLEEVGMLSGVCDVHADTRPSQMKHSEKDVSQLMSAFNDFVTPLIVRERILTCCIACLPGKPLIPQLLKILSIMWRPVRKLLKPLLMTGLLTKR
jgi:hypothetical protein